MAGGTISWVSKKQATVALSTVEAEYVALSSATQEVVWLRRLLTDQILLLIGDNQGGCYCENPINHARTKRIDIYGTITFVRL